MEPAMVSMTLFSTSAVASHGPAASRKAPASVYRSTCNSEPPGSLQTGPLQGNFDPVAELPVLAERSVMPLEVDRRNSPMPESDVIVEVEPYIADPGQALGYKIGQMEIARLRREAEQKLRPKFDVKAFHRVVLTNGS